MSRPSNTSYDVFVSHSSADSGWVKMFVKHLDDLGIRSFLAPKSIEPATNFTDKIREALLHSKMIVLIMTPAALVSVWVHIEAAMQMLGSKACPSLLPVLLENTDLSHLPPRVLDIQRIDLTTGATRIGEYRRLLTTLLKTSGQPEPQQLPLPPILPLSKSFEPLSCGYAFAVGSHWDDILLGCLGTLLKLKLIYGYRIEIVVLCTHYPCDYYGVGQSGLEQRAKKIYQEICSRYELGYEFYSGNHTTIADRAFSNSVELLNAAFLAYADKHQQCNLVFTPPVDDRNQDHSLTGRLALSYFRRPHQTVLEYEIKPHSDRGFVPNVFVGLSEEIESKSGGTKRSVAETKMGLLQELVVQAEDSKVNGSDFLFDAETLRARLRTNALDYGGDKQIRYGEAFRGAIRL